MPHVTQPVFRTDRIELVPLADEHLELEVELDSDRRCCAISTQALEHEQR